MARRFPVIALALGGLGLALLVEGLWIPAKAAVAQLLLRQAWAETLAGEARARPWPWADTWPVARLRSPGHKVDLIVLAGVGGESLPFAPGHMDGTALPGAEGTALIAGHRDTHFEFLRRLRLGDRLTLETPAGGSLEYRVVDLTIVDVRKPLFLETGSGTNGSSMLSGGRHLALVTCYPFDTPVPGGPLRYVVTAEAVETGSMVASLR